MAKAHVRHQDAAAGGSKRRLLSPADNPLVRAVGRLPAGVHAKLLVAFVGTALLVVVVGVLGLRLLGESNERVETLGTLQERAFAYGKLRSDASHVRGLLAQNVGSDYYKVFPEDVSNRTADRQLEDRPGDRERRRPDGGIDAAGQSRLPAFGRRRAVPAQDSCNERPALERHGRDHRVGRRRSRTREIPSCACRTDRDRPQPACHETRECPSGEGRRSDRTERQRVHELAEPLHRRRGRGDRRSHCCSGSCSRGR